MGRGSALAASGSVLLAALAGCSSYEAPNLKVTEAQLTERTDEGAVVMFTIDAENPNAESLPLRGVNYSVSLDGKKVFEGWRSPEATLRRYGTQQIHLPAVVAAGEPALAADQARYRIEGTLEYITPGEIAEILFDAGVRKPSVQFSGEGMAGMVAPAKPVEPPVKVVPAKPAENKAGEAKPGEGKPADAKAPEAEKKN